VPLESIRYLPDILGPAPDLTGNCSLLYNEGKDQFAEKAELGGMI
jgi:hypothetical protein